MEGEDAVEVEVVDKEEDLEEEGDRKVMEVKVTAITLPWDHEMGSHQVMDQFIETINSSLLLF